MAKIFSVNFNKSINDKYGATATLGATATVRNDEKGMALKCNSVATDYITYGDIAAINAIGTGEFSFVVGANNKGFLNHGSGYNSFIGKTTSLGTTGFALSLTSATAFTFNILNVNGSVTINSFNKNNLYIVTRNAAGLCSTYVNGILQGIPFTQAGNISNAGILGVGYDGNQTSRTPNASIYLSEVYNHCLSTTEIQKLNQDFQNQFPISKPKRGFLLNKPSDLSYLKYDKAGYSLFTLNFLTLWNVVNATIINNKSFSTSIGAGGIAEGVTPIYAGKRYRLSVSGTTTATNFDIYNGAGAGRINLTGLLSGSFSTTLDFTASATTEAVLYLRNSTNGTTILTYYSVTELTGLVAAYNFIMS